MNRWTNYRRVGVPPVLVWLDNWNPGPLNFNDEHWTQKQVHVYNGNGEGLAVPVPERGLNAGIPWPPHYSNMFHILLILPTRNMYLEIFVFL